MARYRKVRKGMNAPGVSGGGRNENDNEKEKLIRQKQGDTASKGVAAAHGKFRQSERHNSGMNFSSTDDTSADEVKKRDRSPLLEGTKKPKAA